MSECAVYDNDTLIRDFVPAKKADGTIGLYDRVSGTVYTNAGTGAFTAGPVVPDIPEPEPDPEPVLDPYTWYEENVPTKTQMRLYLNNVAAIYKTLLSEPALPESMANLTAAGANQIEEALSTINNYIARISLSFWRCGEILCGEG